MESMEEYIWVLLQFCEYKNSCTLSEKAVEQLQEAILSILSDKKQNMERIKALEEENKSKQKAYDDCYCEYKQYKQFESIPIQKVKDLIKNETIDISGFECIAVEDLKNLLKEKTNE